jgi:transcriptional regulator with XRE-family HTH domain
MNQSDLAKHSGISRSYISRLLGGEFHELSDANFAKLLKVFAADPQGQAELVAARCLDVKAGVGRTPGAELVEIHVRQAPGATAGAPVAPTA